VKTIIKSLNMDNKIFNVNGKTKEQLSIAVKLLLLNEYGQTQKVTGWYYSKEKGLVLTWLIKDGYKATPFTDRMGKQTEIDDNELIDILWRWLDTEEAKNVECGGWDADSDHDGDNELGWRLYVDEWGHVQETAHSIDHYSIAAFKPAYLWYGK
jgi:hypothetical protein